MTKLESLIEQARQNPDRISPGLLAKLNHHLQQTGGELIPLPWAPVRKAFPPSPWADDKPTVDATQVQPCSNMSELKNEYKRLTEYYQQNPAEFTSDAHSRLYRLRALLVMSESAQKL